MKEKLFELIYKKCHSHLSKQRGCESAGRVGHRPRASLFDEFRMRLNNRMFRQTAPLNEISKIRIIFKHFGLYNVHVPVDGRENDFSKVFSFVIWRKYRLWISGDLSGYY